MQQGQKILSIVLFGIMAAAGWAQNDDQASSAATSASPDAITVPDSNPVTGVHSLTLGSSEGSRNVLIPSLNFSEMFDSNAALQNQRPGYEEESFLGGSLQLHHGTEHQDLSLKYSGGAVIYAHNSLYNTTYQQFGISQSFSLQRWNFLMSDDFSYSPESPLYGGTSAFGNSGYSSAVNGTGSGLDPNLLPNQSIYTTNSSRIMNTVSGQLAYNLSRRSSVNVSGSYGLLHYGDNGYLSGNEIAAQTGYSHNLNAHDSLGVFYAFSRFGYTNISSQFDTHSVQLTYGRRLTGRTALQLSAGPQLVRTGGISGSQNDTSWTASASLQYQRVRTGLSLAYSHGVSGGSGVLLGSYVDSVSGGVSRTLGRTWNVGASGGYSKNRSLELQTDAYDSWSAGAQIGHNIGQTAHMYVSYNMQRQTSTIAPTTLTGTNFVRNLITVGFDWRFRPIRLGQ